MSGSEGAQSGGDSSVPGPQADGATRDRRLATLVRVGLGLLLVAAVLWWVDLEQLRRQLVGVGAAGFLAVVAAHTGDRLLMAFKWQRLVAAKGPAPSLGVAIRAYYVSSFAGVFLPMTVGADLVRVAALRGRSPTSSGAVVASIVVERAVGLISQALYCALSLALIVGLQLGTDIPLGWLAGAVVAMILGTALALPVSFRLAAWSGRRLEASGGLLAKLGGLAEEYASWRDHPGAIRAFFVLTLVEGAFPILTYAAAAWALGIETSVVEMAAVVPIVYLVARLPLTSIGPEQSGFALGATAVTGIAAADAAAITFLVSPISLLVALLPGAVAWVALRRRES